MVVVFGSSCSFSTKELASRNTRGKEDDGWAAHGGGGLQPFSSCVWVVGGVRYYVLSSMCSLSHLDH